MKNVPRTLEELATMIAKRDNISFEEAMTAVRDTAAEMEDAFFTGSLTQAEDILREDLGLKPEYLDLFIF